MADWFAIFIDQVYYKVQLRKNQELEKIEDHERTIRTIDLENAAPLAESTEKHSDEGALSHEVIIGEPDFMQEGEGETTTYAGADE